MRYCYNCKGLVDVIEVVREKPHKRKVWLCTACNTILAIQGMRDEK